MIGTFDGFDSVGTGIGAVAGTAAAAVAGPAAAAGDSYSLSSGDLYLSSKKAWVSFFCSFAILFSAFVMKGRFVIIIFVVAVVDTAVAIEPLLWLLLSSCCNSLQLVCKSINVALLLLHYTVRFFLLFRR